jgi:heme o synthase
MLRKIRHYISITKPGIILGNLISASAGFFLASKGVIDYGTFVVTLAGISLVVASGCVLNNYIDLEIDHKMVRTQNRVLVKGYLTTRNALFYAAMMGILGMVLLSVKISLTTSLIVLMGFIIYVVVYSLFMKRNSVYSTLIGSLAGAAPPVAGYCAVTGNIDLGAILLFSIFSLWQMPHCYAIALYRRNDYARAEIPVLPIEKGTARTRIHIVSFILAFLVSVVMLSYHGYTGNSTIAISLILGLVWLYFVVFGYNQSNERNWARKLYIFSILTIIILSLTISIDFRNSVTAGLAGHEQHQVRITSVL